MPILRTATLGCRVNQYETEFVRQGLERVGFRDALEEEAADLCIVNTCTVTHEGDAKSRQTIRQLAKRNPDARIVVMGCFATRAPEEVAALPNVAEVIADKRELPDFLQRCGVVDVPTGITRFDGRRRAYVKVQDGCILSCTFCIIPSVRPGLRSRPVEHIVDEVQALVAGGHREVVLTGIHLGHYGIDFNQGRAKTDWLRLSHLLERLANLEGEFRIRLSSIEATEVTRELIAVMAKYPERICPHLHVSMQSGSDTVLRRMRRRWGAQRFVDRCRLLQDSLDLPALTTDVIVGFPGETEQEFAETLAVCERVGFSKIHVFPFSARQGTDAATMFDQISPPVKQRRVAELESLADSLRDRYHAALFGRRLQLLVEGRLVDREGVVAGTACRYAQMELSAENFHGRLPERSTLVEVVAGRSSAGRVEALPPAGSL
ncbi:MAG: tRNA (N(6)-L-threonylcarbamoyladenosine(37)-C(2))-methylthiotransferase MtaB [Planctomycetaceae bacterium]|nr:tRNA (N(6)-L-threonylcarbamoyladenosine(37)-C(2))-methylthiotransferase MtaB [Planctomycetaceae bacterium]